MIVVMRSPENGGVPVSRSVTLTGLASYAVHNETFSGADAWDVLSAGTYALRAVISPPVTGDPDAVDERSHDVNFDKQAYYKTSIVTNDYASNDISTTGAAVPFTGSGGSPIELSFPAGFEFPYYGIRYDKLQVAKYGFVSLNPDPYNFADAPAATLPHTSKPNAAIYGCHTSLETTQTGQGVWTEHLTGLQRRLVIKGGLRAGGLTEDPADLSVAQEQIVRPLQEGTNSSDGVAGSGRSDRHRERDHRQPLDRKMGTDQHREQKRRPGGRLPCPPEPAPSGGLVFGHQNPSIRGPFGCLGQQIGVGRSGGFDPTEVRKSGAGKASTGIVTQHGCNHMTCSPRS